MIGFDADRCLSSTYVVATSARGAELESLKSNFHVGGWGISVFMWRCDNSGYGG